MRDIRQLLLEKYIVASPYEDNFLSPNAVAIAATNWKHGRVARNKIIKPEGDL